MLSTLQAFTRIASNIERETSRVSSDRVTQREKAYYLAEIGKVKSVDDFMSNQRIYRFALKAFGLQDMANSKALVRKVLEGGTDDPRSLANTLADPRYREFVETFNFKRYTNATTSFGRAQQGVVDRFLRQALEENAGQGNEGVRLALYFQRKAPEVTSVYGLLADRALYKVVETALSLPSSLPAVGIEKQAQVVASKLKISDLKDPEALGKLIRRFASLWDLSNGQNTAASNAASLLNISGSSSVVGISPETMASIQALRLGRK